MSLYDSVIINVCVCDSRMLNKLPSWLTVTHNQWGVHNKRAQQLDLKDLHQIETQWISPFFNSPDWAVRRRLMHAHTPYDRPGGTDGQSVSLNERGTIRGCWRIVGGRRLQYST